jgi:hypothetical protein
MPMTKERDAEQDDRKSDAWGEQVSDGHDRWGGSQKQPPLTGRLLISFNPSSGSSLSSFRREGTAWRIRERSRSSNTSC